MSQPSHMSIRASRHAHHFEQQQPAPFRSPSSRRNPAHVAAQPHEQPQLTHSPQPHSSSRPRESRRSPLHVATHSRHTSSHWVATHFHVAASSPTPATRPIFTSQPPAPPQPGRDPFSRRSLQPHPSHVAAQPRRSPSHHMSSPSSPIAPLQLTLPTRVTSRHMSSPSAYVAAQPRRGPSHVAKAPSPGILVTSQPTHVTTHTNRHAHLL
jgi:hypothetical protein